MMRRHLKRIVLGLLALAVLAEIVLQVFAYGAWTQRRAGEVRGAGDGPVVLCVGDSMTYGLGSNEGGSYPAQLERHLRARDERAWVVVNGGRSGRNSAQVAQLLPDQLARYAPKFVLVLIGTNDWWSRPAIVDPDALRDEESFPIEWRLAKMLRVVVEGRFGETDSQGFVGTWNKDGAEVQFQSSGRMLYAGQELRWELRDGVLAIVQPDETVVEVAWRRDGELLRLTSTIWNEEQVLQPGPAAAPGPLQRGRALAANGDVAGAIAVLREVLADPAHASDVPAARAELSALAMRQQDRDGALEQLAALRALRAAAPTDAEVVAHTMRAEVACEQFDRAVDSAFDLTALAPADDRGWEVLLRHGVPRGQTPRIMAAIERAVAALPAGHEWRANLLVQRALLCDEADAAGFLRDLFAGLRDGADPEHIVNQVHMRREHLRSVDFEAATRALTPTPSEQADWLGVFERGLHSGAGVLAVLGENLTSILASCRAAGAEPLLLDYPFRDLRHESLVDGIASAHQVRRVHVRPRFEQLLETVPRHELFYRDDIHCVDRGYAIMAELAADVLLR